MKKPVRASVTAGVAAMTAVALTYGVPAPPERTPPTVAASPMRLTAAVEPLAAPAKLPNLLAGLRPLAASAAVTSEPVVLNAAGDAIIAAWDAVLPWIDYGVNLADFVLGFIPGGYLIGDQINIFYFSLIRPIANSFVVNLVAPVVNAPLDPASYVNGLVTLGTVAVNSLINFGISEFNYFFGWLIPPIPPLPPIVLDEPTVEGTAEELTMQTLSEELVTEPEEPVEVVEVVEVVEQADDTEDVTEEVTEESTEEVVEEVAEDTSQDLDEIAEITPTKDSSGTVSAQGEVRQPAVTAPTDTDTDTDNQSTDTSPDTVAEDTETGTGPTPSTNDDGPAGTAGTDSAQGDAGSTGGGAGSTGSE